MTPALAPACDISSTIDLFLRSHICVNTRSAYGRALKLYATWLKAQDNTLNVDLDTAIRYRDHILAGYAESSAAQHIAAVKALYRVAKELGLIQINVWAVVKAPTPVDAVAKTKALISADLAAVYAKAEASGPRDYLIVRLLYEVGLRRSEVAGLLKASVEVTADGPAIRVTGKGSKTALVGITEGLASAITVYSATITGVFMFPGRGGETAISERQINNVLTGFGVHPHQLRHTHVSDALGLGHSIQDVSRSVRHTNVSTTMRYYSALEQVRRSSSRVLAPPVSSSTRDCTLCAEEDHLHQGPVSSSPL